jgi:dynein heavy chain
VLKQAGMENKPTVFLFNDTQIAKESFLEDVNNILNNGDVPNLFENEDLSEIAEIMKDVAIARRLGTSPAELYALFVERVRIILHLVICLSPIGEDFRRRLRMFPSLVNCCTIDWFLPWP